MAKGTTASASALWLQTCWWLNTASPSMCPSFFQLSLLPCPRWEWPSQQLQTEAPQSNSCLAKGNHSFKPKMCPRPGLSCLCLELYSIRNYVIIFCREKLQAGKSTLCCMFNSMHSCGKRSGSAIWPPPRCSLAMDGTTVEAFRKGCICNLVTFWKASALRGNTLAASGHNVKHFRLAFCHTPTPAF